MDSFRPARWWIPETLNRLCLPHWIFRRWRRAEVADLYRNARRDGIRMSWSFWNRIERRTPSRANRRSHIARLDYQLDQAKYRISRLEDRLWEAKQQAAAWKSTAEANAAYAERIRMTLRRVKGRAAS